MAGTRDTNGINAGPQRSSKGRSYFDYTTTMQVSRTERRYLNQAGSIAAYVLRYKRIQETTNRARVLLHTVVATWIHTQAETILSAYVAARQVPNPPRRSVFGASPRINTSWSCNETIGFGTRTSSGLHRGEDSVNGKIIRIVYHAVCRERRQPGGGFQGGPWLARVSG